MLTAYWSHFLNSYLLEGEEPPVCIPYDQLCSSVLFHECSPDNIIEFLKCMNSSNKLTLLCTLILFL